MPAYFSLKIAGWLRIVRQSLVFVFLLSALRSGSHRIETGFIPQAALLEKREEEQRHFAQGFERARHVGLYGVERQRQQAGCFDVAFVLDADHPEDAASLFGQRFDAAV